MILTEKGENSTERFSQYEVNELEENQFKTLDGKLTRALKLLALNIVKDAKGDAQVRILSSAGFPSSEIAEMLGKKRNAVDQALHRLKNERNKREDGGETNG